MLNKRQLLAALAAAVLVAGGCDRIKGLMGKGGVDQDSLAKAHALQARKDSLAKAQAVRDSVARVHWVSCSDSVETTLKKTAAGRKELRGKAKMPAGMLLPSVLKACGAAPPPPPAKPIPPATRDSLVRAHWTACSDSVEAALKKTAAGRKALKATLPPGTLLPQVLKACGAAPTSPATKPVTPAPTGKPGVAAPVSPGATAPVAAAKPAPPAAQVPAKPTLTPAQQRIVRADSIRKAKDAAQAEALAKAKAQARTDSLAKVTADSIRADSIRLAKETEVLRETFAYTGGSRDPFISLIQRNSSSVEFGDLVLIGIYQDLRASRNSVALLRNKNTGKRYKVHIGEKIGQRMTVSQITDRDVSFTIQDFGFERQETLSLTKKGEEDTQ
ncbi:MAG TPA: hypothetical protein VFI39_01705 [Gemmatimonadales bacterium]|nr:hypothetical protein [Gemmatimonadales bacterium]